MIRILANVKINNDLFLYSLSITSIIVSIIFALIVQKSNSSKPTYKKGKRLKLFNTPIFLHNNSITAIIDSKSRDDGNSIKEKSLCVQAVTNWLQFATLYFPLDTNKPDNQFFEFNTILLIDQKNKNDLKQLNTLLVQTLELSIDDYYAQEFFLTNIAVVLSSYNYELSLAIIHIALNYCNDKRGRCLRARAAIYRRWGKESLAIIDENEAEDEELAYEI